VRLTALRLAAYAIDVVVLAAVLLPLSFAIGSVIGTELSTGMAVWIRSLLTISLPAWAYFIATDHLAGGRSLGKRVLGLRARMLDGGTLGWGPSVLRTALKLLPWELTHLAFFALAPRLGAFEGIQVVVSGTAYALMIAYLVVAVRNDGRRSVPDLVAGTTVDRVVRRPEA
jgi:uncharacterized RDD family membrane protein YckC